MSATDLLDALCAHTGIVCAVGAGGKKTTLYRLLRAHPGRVAFTATTFTPEFPDDLPARRIIAEPDRLLAAVLAAVGSAAKLAYACPSSKSGRHAGVSPAQVVECHTRGGFDMTLVKADGARMRLLKAPGENEPNLVPGASTVLGLVSARVIGMPLSSRHVHRPERVAAVTGAQPDELLTPCHVARLIASDEGLLHGAARLRFIPVINMADAAGNRVAALASARMALDLSDRYDRVVVAAMTSEEPIIEVVTRPGA